MIMSISTWYPQSPPWWTHWQNLRKCMWRVWNEFTRRFRTKAQLGPNASESTKRRPSWLQNSTSKLDTAKERMKASISRKESKISLKVHMKEQLFNLTLDHCEDPRIAIQVQNNNKSTWMQMRCSPSLWSSFFIFSKSPLLHFISPYHIFTNSSPPLTMESSTILSSRDAMQIEKEA